MFIKKLIWGAGIKAIETTGRINAGGNLLLDEHLHVLSSAKVRVIILVPEYANIDETKCGDTICEGDETCETCDDDCGECPECLSDEDCNIRGITYKTCNSQTHKCDLMPDMCDDAGNGCTGNKHCSIVGSNYCVTCNDYETMCHPTDKKKHCDSASGKWKSCVTNMECSGGVCGAKPSDNNGEWSVEWAKETVANPGCSVYGHCN